MKLHFEILPPAIYKNAGHEQDFYVLIDETKLININDFVTQEIHEGSGKQLKIKAMRCDVSLNDASAFKPLIVKVPVMLHYEGGTIKITATSEKGEVLWQKSMTYELPGQHFPKVRMSSKWKQIDNMNAVCSLKPDEIAQEKWNFVGPIHRYIRFTDDYSLTLNLGIQIVLTHSLEPMTYYVDRIYALKTLDIYLSQDLLGGLPPITPTNSIDPNGSITP